MSFPDQSPPSHYGHGGPYGRFDGNKGNDDHDDNNTFFSSILPNLGVITLRATLGMTVVLYILNQQHLLPRPLSSVVSKALFWPTLPITASKRIGKWMTKIDDTVVMGGAPFGFLGYPQTLREKFGVKGVINLCEEYRGPLKQYKELGMEELYLPTTDHFEPSREDMLSALSFLKRHEAMGNKVYVHCRAGHGRSGAVVFAWMLLKDPNVDPQQLNVDFCKMRHVRKSLWKQPNVQALHRRFRETGGSFINAQDTFFQKEKDDDQQTDPVADEVDKKEL
ncbi:protein-tyrosine phosphatase [Nitzschia inconspicua]|uniref:Protein-tyrosine phosphatase n=1 Tax=Nitzschia inconspicua TaxID=303405 RepID=A0A9K3KSE6_9STRA|nr:protein-tyrosine phosphatase [Nitzschia inconspicua]